MDRTTAISIICEHELVLLTKEKREELLLAWWGIDSEDPEFAVLPAILRKEMLESDEPFCDVMDTLYNPLLMEALKYEYFGVKNEYLSKRVSIILGKECIIEGQPESLLACPCCQYQTLKERGRYIICPVCFWEDDGNNEPSKYSFSNRLTLEEGRTNFINYGVATKLALAHIKHDVKERYHKKVNTKQDD